MSTHPPVKFFALSGLCDLQKPAKYDSINQMESKFPKGVKNDV